MRTDRAHVRFNETLSAQTYGRFQKLKLPNLYSNLPTQHHKVLVTLNIVNFMMKLFFTQQASGSKRPSCSISTCQSSVIFAIECHKTFKIDTGVIIAPTTSLAGSIIKSTLSSLHTLVEVTYHDIMCDWHEHKQKINRHYPSSPKNTIFPWLHTS